MAAWERILQNAEGLRSDGFQGRGTNRQEVVSFMEELMWAIKNSNLVGVTRLYVNGKDEQEELVLHGNKEAVERVATFLASAAADEGYDFWHKQGKDEDEAPFIRYGEPYAWRPLQGEEYSELVVFNE